MGGVDPDAVLCSITQQVMAEMARNSGERSCTIEQFTRIKPPSFFGGAEPLVAENWVQDIKDMLVVFPCIEEQKVSFTAFKLTGEAKRWWRSTRLLEEWRPDPVAMTWSHFRKLLLERCFPSTIRSAKVVEFLHLT
ncbi:uncharacterized protein LOC131163460 [Malania oleifera]|uniref:uncharacterized protein LOC131163460 n=1 Tax=Malania oleifera TaxID=397392 RepID=UPI0025ADEC85|nr:uncharacterized protein LOC131163460 [Malania oleifera]